MRRTLLILAGVILPGCALEVSYEDTRYQCDDGACPAGYLCVANFCESEATGPEVLRQTAELFEANQNSLTFSFDGPLEKDNYVLAFLLHAADNALLWPEGESSWEPLIEPPPVGDDADVIAELRAFAVPSTRDYVLTFEIDRTESSLMGAAVEVQGWDGGDVFETVEIDSAQPLDWVGVRAPEGPRRGWFAFAAGKIFASGASFSWTGADHLFTAETGGGTNWVVSAASTDGVGPVDIDADTAEDVGTGSLVLVGLSVAGD